MPGLNVQQKLLTFATSFGVTYVLLGLSKNIFTATLKFLNAAFDNKDREKEVRRRIEKEVRRRIREILRRREEVEVEEEAAGKTD